MKNRKLLFILFSIITPLLITYGQTPENSISYNKNSDTEARCTGSAYCSACKNCSRCAHCNSGGSCGVCAGSYSSKKSSSRKSSGSRNYYNSHSTTSNRSNNKSQSNTGYSTSSNKKNENIPDDIYSENYNKTLIVNTRELNVRSGPGTNYSIIHKLSYMEEVLFLGKINDWIKIRVKSIHKTGYVHKKYLATID